MANRGGGCHIERQFPELSNKRFETDSLRRRTFITTEKRRAATEHLAY